jgi:methionyl-tRNA formyltransferase
MRVGFAGTPDFAARAMVAVHADGHTIPLVLTQPDRPSGRGMTVTPSPVKRYAVAHALEVRQPETLRTPGAQGALFAVDLDVLVVAAYGLILPQAVLDWPRHGCLNIHASLLPRWRGAAPIARAIEAGDTETGITIMQMNGGLDTGPMVCREAIAIESRDTAGSLHDRLATVGARLIVGALRMLERDGALETTPQPPSGITYARKIDRADRGIDWSHDAAAIDRKVRALAPAPGAVAMWRGAAFKVASALPLERVAEGEPGTVAAVGAAGIDVVCGADEPRRLLRLVELQPAGGRSMSANAFAAGRGVTPGVRLESGVGEVR